MIEPLAKKKVIKTVQDLMDLQKEVAKGADYRGVSIVQEVDLDLTETIQRMADRSWIPIGDSTNQFQGEYTGLGSDGVMHTITGLNLIRCNTVYAGLFGFIGKAGSVKSLWLKDVAVSLNKNHSYTGGLVGECHGLVSGCIVTGKVKNTGTQSYTGGLAGAVQQSGKVEGCFFDGSVDGGSGSFAGGIAGQTGNSVTAGEEGGYIHGCYNHASVACPEGCAGGIVGKNSAKLECCYNLGRISAGKGIAGELEKGAEAKHCYYWTRSVEVPSGCGEALWLSQMLEKDFKNKLDPSGDFFTRGLEPLEVTVCFTPCLSAHAKLEQCLDAVLKSTTASEIRAFQIVTPPAPKTAPIQLKWRMCNGKSYRLSKGTSENPVNAEEDSYEVSVSGKEAVSLELICEDYYNASDTWFHPYTPPYLESFTVQKGSKVNLQAINLTWEDAEGFLAPELLLTASPCPVHFSYKRPPPPPPAEYEYTFSWKGRNAAKYELIVDGTVTEYGATAVSAVMKLKELHKAVLWALDGYGYGVSMEGKE